jgi:16S rRNA processing protein RimM
MFLLGRLAKVQGLKGEFLLDSATEFPELIPSNKGLLLAPPGEDLSAGGASPSCVAVTVRIFRWHKGRPCLAFGQILDRTASEPYKDWNLWGPHGLAELKEGESFRRDWVGCQVFAKDEFIGEVAGLEPSPAGYDMVRIKDMRPGRSGLRDVPFIKAWFDLDLNSRQIRIDPPEGLLELDRMK